MVYVQDINGKPMMPTTRHGKEPKRYYIQEVEIIKV